MKIVGNASITSKQPQITGIHSKSVHSSGCQIILEGGIKMIDWVMGLSGPLAGYSPTWWIDAVMKGMENASSSIAARSEKEAAEALDYFYPWAEAVRFMSDGSSPNEAAVRIARAVTGRNRIAFCGYHGTGTSFPHNPDVNDLRIDERRGIPAEMWQLTTQFMWGDFEALRMLPRDLAAIIVEVPSDDAGAEKFIGECLLSAHLRDALLIVDDVVTGFRVAAGGAPEKYEVTPDLCCLGKALGNGFNVSALIGKAQHMNLLTAGVHYSSTFNGSGLACSVVAATLRWMQQEHPIPILCQRGSLLKNKMNAVFADSPLLMVGNPTRPSIISSDSDFLKTWLYEMTHCGVYCLAAPWYVTMAHTEEIIHQTVEAAARSIKEISI